MCGCAHCGVRIRYVVCVSVGVYVPVGVCGCACMRACGCESVWVYVCLRHTCVWLT